jgi:hypothetical protein
LLAKQLLSEIENNNKCKIVIEDLLTACQLLQPISLPHDVSGERMRDKAIELINKHKV